jgi:hypothetical protein
MARHLLQDEPFPVRETDLALGIPADPDAVYWLRPMTRDASREMRKRNTKQVPNRRTHQLESKVSDEQLDDDILDYIIVKWEGVTNGNGGPAPCDLAHKVKLPLEVQGALLARAVEGGEPPDSTASFRKPA